MCPCPAPGRLGQVNISGKLSAVWRDPLVAVLVVLKVVLPDDSSFSSCHSEGVSRMGATALLNILVTPAAVLADILRNRHPLRDANAAPTDVGTCREYS